MIKFDVSKLRSMRKEKGLTIAAMAKRLEQSPAQIHRLETGQRRLTIDLLLQYCESLGVDVDRLFARDVVVPIIGVIDDDYQIMPLSPNMPYQTLAPRLVPNPNRLAAIRWEPTRRVSQMYGHLMFFYADIVGIPEAAWKQRCVIRRRDGTQCVGWPVREGNQTHIDRTEGAGVEFNVEITWASPILGVLSPIAFHTDLLPPPSARLTAPF